jgi:uncharacterized integral membrane protein
MRLLSAIAGFVFLMVILVFTLSNKQSASVSLWPFDMEVTAPLSLWMLGSLGAGLLFGSGFVWIGALPHRIRMRRLGRDIVSLSDRLLQAERELEQYRAKAAPAKTPLLTGSKWRFWERF